MARGTGVAVEISALLKGAQWGKKDGGPLASTRRRGRGAWYDALMSWRPGGGVALDNSRLWRRRALVG
jgi:hypothetical protein